MSLGPAEILVILVIALIVFGPHKLPDVGRQVGRTMREFRKFQEAMKRDLGDVFGDDVDHESDPPPTLPPKEPEANGRGAGVPTRSEPGPERPGGEAAESGDLGPEPGTEAPPDAARTD